MNGDAGTVVVGALLNSVTTGGSCKGEVSVVNIVNGLGITVVVTGNPVDIAELVVGVESNPENGGELLAMVEGGKCSDDSPRSEESSFCCFNLLLITSSFVAHLFKASSILSVSESQSTDSRPTFLFFRTFI